MIPPDTPMISLTYWVNKAESGSESARVILCEDGK